MKSKHLGTIEGISCHVMPYDPPASRENAIDQLLYRSKVLGGNGIANVQCQEEGVSFSKNCENSVTCNAVAVQVERIPHAPTIAAPQASMRTQSAEQAKKAEANEITTVRPLDVEQLQAGVETERPCVC